jgi:stress-induced morphogen
MAINIPRGKSDEVIERIIEALRVFEADHPESQIDIYRQNPVSVRVRIIDPAFAGQSKVERSKEVWKCLDSLSDDVQSDLSTLILLAPEETKMSFANLEFEDPVPSNL